MVERRRYGPLIILIILAALALWYQERQQAIESINTTFEEPSSEGFLRIEKWDCEPEGDYVMFTGRVRNTHDSRTLRWPELRGRVENRQGTTLNSRSGVTDSDRIGPGDTSTFEFSVPDPSGTASGCFISVEEAEFVR